MLADVHATLQKFPILPFSDTGIQLFIIIIIYRAEISFCCRPISWRRRWWWWSVLSIIIISIKNAFMQEKYMCHFYRSNSSCISLARLQPMFPLNSFESFHPTSTGSVEGKHFLYSVLNLYVHSERWCETRIHLESRLSNGGWCYSH